MPTAFSHVVVGASFGSALPVSRVPRSLWVIGAICAAAPDADSALYALGVPYGSLLGHRGLSHSLFFAPLIAAAALAAFRGLRGRVPSSLLAFLYLFLCAISHGILDAMTSGGLGVAFFSPFSNHRYFLPWRPIQVAPIGLYDFFTGEASSALLSELYWLGIPCLALILISVVFTSTRAAREA